MSTEAAPSDLFDVVVIGGGINGTGAARDLALRGLQVALVEKRDLGSGATGASSGMIHGGTRYLLHEPAITKLSCTDAGAVRRIAHHMMFRIPFLFPFPKAFKVEGLPPALAYHLFDSMLYAYDLYQPLKGGLPHQRLRRHEALALEPGLEHDIVGAISWDEWGIDAARLCVANAVAAHEAGASIFLRSEATAIEKDESGTVRAVRVREGRTGVERTLRCRAVLNAAGPWGELVARQAGATVRIRQTKGVHVVIGGRVSSYAVATTAVDGRAVFLEPWHDVTLIGTTDDDYYGDLDRLEVTFDEVEYLIEAVETVFPSIREHRVIDTWVGVRPTLWQYGMDEDRVSREHQVFDHAEEGAPGLFSLSGGKLASYRLMAEHAVDALCEHLGNDAACRTAELPLPGAEDCDHGIEPSEWAGAYGVPDHVAHRLAQRHGCRAREILEDAAKTSGGRAVICRCEGVIAAELRYTIRNEWATTVGDLMRRTRLGTGPCGGHGCAHRAAEILAAALGEDHGAARGRALGFLGERLHFRRPGLRRASARGEAIASLDLALGRGGRRLP